MTDAAASGRLAQSVLARRDKQLEDNAARKIFNAVKSWRLKPGEVSQRWMWELIQNASDTAITNKRRLTARFQLTNQELVFEHTAGQFTYDDITALIYGGSAKSFEGIVLTGHFGSGFLVTHAISATVSVSGVSESGEPFQLDFHRTGTADEVRENVSRCLQQLNNPPDADTTCSLFRYRHLGPEGHQIASSGLMGLDRCLPYVFAFTPHLDGVTIVADTEIEWRRGESASMMADGIAAIAVQRVENGVVEDFKVYVRSSDLGDTALLTKVEGSTSRIVPLPADAPRIYRQFPLISSNAVGLPFVINGNFDVDEDRGIAFLTKSATIQQSSAPSADVQKTCSLVGEAVSLFQFVASLPLEDLHLALEIRIPAGQLSQPGPWRQALSRLATGLSRTPVVRVAVPAATVLEPVRCTFVSSSLLRSKNNVALDALWRLVSRYRLSMPPSAVMPVWETIVQGWKELGVDGLTIWTIETVLQKVRGRKNLQGLAEDLEVSVDSGLQWLGEALDILAPIRDALPNDILSGVLPNQYGDFKSPTELRRDNNVDQELKNLSDELGPPTLRFELLDSRLTNVHGERDALLQLYVHDFIDTAVAFRKIVQHVRSRVPTPQTRKPGWKLEEPLKVTIAKLALWAAARGPEHDAAVRELPWITADLEPRYLGTEQLAMLPVELWEESARNFADIYPESKRLASIYAEVGGDLTGSLTTALINWGVCPAYPVTVSLQARLNRDLVKLLSDGSPDSGLLPSYLCDEVSDIAFLSEVLRRVKENENRAALFMSFLLQYVASRDDHWRSHALARAANGTTVTIRPSEWLARVKKDQWVPVLNRETDELEPTHASAETLSRFVAWDELAGNRNAEALLRLLGFDVLELAIKIASGGSKKVEQSLKTELAQVVTSTDMAGLQMLVEQLKKRRAGQERIAQNRAFGLRIQALVQHLLEERHKRVIVDDRGYDFRVYERGDADPETDVTLFAAGPYLVEVKSARSEEVALSETQATTSAANEPTYVLFVVDLRACTSPEPGEVEVMNAIRIVPDIGTRVHPLLATVEEVCTGDGGIRVDAGKQLRYCVSQSVWSVGIGLNEWIDISF